MGYLMANDCNEHSEHAWRLERNEKDIRDKTREIWQQGVIPLRKQISVMIRWVIAGMGAVILHLGLTLLQWYTNRGI